MITGTSEADVTVFVVASTLGAFEASVSKNSQTHVNILLSSTFGVNQVIGAVNEMDEKTLNYSKNRYNETQTEISNFLKRTGFNPDKIPFVPMSGFNGDNMIERSKDIPWYNGQTTS